MRWRRRQFARRGTACRPGYGHGLPPIWDPLAGSHALPVLLLAVNNERMRKPLSVAGVGSVPTWRHLSVLPLQPIAGPLSGPGPNQDETTLLVMSIVNSSNVKVIKLRHSPGYLSRIIRTKSRIVVVWWIFCADVRRCAMLSTYRGRVHTGDSNLGPTHCQSAFSQSLCEIWSVWLSDWETETLIRSSDKERLSSHPYSCSIYTWQSLFCAIRSSLYLSSYRLHRTAFIRYGQLALFLIDNVLYI